MVRLILDPNLFVFSCDLSKEEQMEQLLLLISSLSFVNNYFDVSVDQYSGASHMQFFSEMNGGFLTESEFGKSREVRVAWGQIIKQIQKMLLKGNNVDLADTAITDCPLRFSNNDKYEIPFSKYLFCALFGESKCENNMLLLSKNNKSCSPTATFFWDGASTSIDAVVDPSIDCNGIVAKYLISTDLEDEMFPYSCSCKKLNEAFLNECTGNHLDNGQKQAIYHRYGSETASRNKYIRHAYLSRKNPQYIVFAHQKNKFYFSIDMEHGGIEVFRNQGKSPPHLGEYDFSCRLQKEADPTTHKLII